MRTVTLLLMLSCSAAIAGEKIDAAPPVAATSNQALTSAAFVNKAAQSGLLEVEAGKLAASKSNDANVKLFAQKMVTDHTNAGAELDALAGGRYPHPKQLDAEHQAKLDALKQKSGTEFDKAYGEDMMQDHDTAVKLFTQAQNAQDVTPELQAFAKKTLPTLRDHHQMAMKLPGAHTK